MIEIKKKFTLRLNFSKYLGIIVFVQRKIPNIALTKVFRPYPVIRDDKAKKITKLKKYFK